MRVLFWVPRFWPYIGGVETLSTRLLPVLRERGCDFIVVTSQDHPDVPHEERYKGIPIYRFPFRAALANGNLEQLLKIRRQVATLKRNFAPELIHLQMTPINPADLFHLQTSDAHPAPLLATLHVAVKNHTIGRHTLLEQTLRSADWVTANSAAVLAEARQLVPEITPYSSLIYNSLDVPALPSEPPPRDAPRLLCVGRLSKEKGFDLALTAFASLRERFHRLRLVIAGAGPARPELEQQAAELDLTDSVEFVGSVCSDEVPALMNAATIVVMPSREEGFGLVALEAALMARPVVATRVGGLPEVVVHQQTGLLVEPDDSATLAEAIALLLAHPETAAQMGEAARHRAQELFSWDRCVDAYAALYRTLTKEAGHGESGRSTASQ